ncbi:MAG: indole-3-glycerol-phosphate synthase, partial [Methanomicrobiales archaeon]|nr:indole-3-glycerol-phosphate synthase [Methanomicrobiales archaeon]
SLSLKLGMEPVVEVHDPADVECARATDAGIIGINNRDLETMKVDLATTGRIAPLCGDATIISMSGIRTDDDIRRMKGSCHAFLIGTALMKARYPGVAMEGFVSA